MNILLSKNLLTFIRALYIHAQRYSHTPNTLSVLGLIVYLGA